MLEIKRHGESAAPARAMDNLFWLGPAMPETHRKAFVRILRAR